jgi:hypothetical protein
VIDRPEGVEVSNTTRADRAARVDGAEVPPDHYPYVVGYLRSVLAVRDVTVEDFERAIARAAATEGGRRREAHPA